MLLENFFFFFLTEEKLKSAAKSAAASLGGDVNKTEAELLNKIFSAGTSTSVPEDSANSSKPSSQSSLRLIDQTLLSIIY